MELTQTEAYAQRGLDQLAVKRLSLLGDLLLGAGFNVTSITAPEGIETFHFLDCLALLDLEAIRSAEALADLGSGAGLPALVLAAARPDSKITAVESQQKKCDFIAATAHRLELTGVEVICARAEDYGRGHGRDAHDTVVSRALAPLSVVVEYSMPLLRQGGTMVAMKGAISNEECIHAEKALDILGAGTLESRRLEPFEGAENRWVYLAKKLRPTPDRFPRRPGMPSKRPLGT